jgi:hypothetical protein
MLGSDLAGQIIFQPGAMPKAEKVVLHIRLQVAKEGNGGDSFDLGMNKNNLPSLQKVHVILHHVGVTAEEVKRWKATLAAALHAHPNSPTCQFTTQGIFRYPEGKRWKARDGWAYPKYYCPYIYYPAPRYASSAPLHRQRCKDRVDVVEVVDVVDSRDSCCIM